MGERAGLNPQSMKARILLLGAFLILIGVVLRTMLAVPLVEKRVQELVQNQQMSLASYIAQDIEHDLQSRLSLVKRFAAEFPSGLADSPAELARWLDDRQRINPLFDAGLVAIAPNGDASLGASPALHGAAWSPVGSRVWFQQALGSDGSAMSEPQTAFSGEGLAILFAAPVRDATGALHAVLVGSASLGGSGFLQRLQQARSGQTGGFVLVSPQSRLFVASSDASLMLAPTPPPGTDALHDKAMAGYRGSGVMTHARGLDELAAIAAVPTAGWFVVASMPVDEALQPISTLWTLVSGSTVSLALTTMLLLLLLLPRILRPLTDAARSIHDMADGTVPLQPLAVKNDDEVGTLVRGFNFLVARLKREEAAREASEARLKFLAHHDALTGLFNRATLEDRLQRALERIRHQGSQLAVLFCDLDGFKAINDQQGHGVGDAVLKQAAERLCVPHPGIDTVARLGGDEFVIVVVANGGVQQAAEDIAHQVLQAISLPFVIDGKALDLGVSIGVAVHAGVLQSASQLLASADTAMYDAKRRGRGRVSLGQSASMPNSLTTLP